MSATLEGRTALVTGGSRGIGAAICARLAAEGAHVVGTATSESGAQAIGEALGSSGEGRVLDVRDSNAVRKLVGELSRVDILVNNAGITRDGLAMRMKDEDWDAVLATNLSAAFVCARAVLRGMMQAHFRRADRLVVPQPRLGGRRRRQPGAGQLLRLEGGTGRHEQVAGA